jgi:hypothetical protein
MNAKSEDIVLTFGPEGKHSLHIPIKDLEAVEKTGRSFVTAGMALLLFAQEQSGIDTPRDLQKLFDWMTPDSEKAA